MGKGYCLIIADISLHDKAKTATLLRIFMRNAITALAALILTGCTASTISVELAPLSEGQLNAANAPVREATIIQEIQIPSEGNIAVPFAAQAPHGNWNDPYQEACEEASVIMLDYFIRNLPLTPDQANREIVQLVTWEYSNGYTYDVNIESLADIVRKYYKYTARVSEHVTADSIMYEIAKGNPVIVPVAGRMLGNPYFSGEGPWYHMLVITGYDKKYFITNDPGTKRGKGYKYKHDVLVEAIHDWTGVKEEIESGAKKMLIIEK